MTLCLMTAAWHLKYTLVLVLPGLGLLTAGVACLRAARRRAARPARLPRTWDGRPEPERSVLNREPPSGKRFPKSKHAGVGDSPRTAVGISSSWMMNAISPRSAETL